MAALNGEVIRDEEGQIVYPFIEKQKAGYKVHVNSRRSIPGVFTSFFQAERALEKDIAVSNSSKRRDK